MSNTFQNNVIRVYDKIADDFSRTRNHPWPMVSSFINDIIESNNQKKINIIEVGCGNGKNMINNDNINWYGCDTCDRFLEICSKKNKSAEFTKCYSWSLPYTDNTFDASLCIAVLHHIDDDNLVIKSINELLRVTKKSKQVLISFWKKTQDNSTITYDGISNAYLVPWTDSITNEIYMRYYRYIDVSKLIEKANIKHNVVSIHEEKNNIYKC